MAIAANIEQRIMGLPPRARREVIDFVEILALKYQKKQDVIQEDVNWKQMSAASMSKVWDNTEDDVYNELL